MRLHFFRGEIQKYFLDNNLPDLYNETARRKIFPQDLEKQIISKWYEFGGGENLFRKTSCAVAYAHGMADYNGHLGIKELCDICPVAQIKRCDDKYTVPTEGQITALLKKMNLQGTPFEITERAIEFPTLREQDRYFIQHALGFQCHDANHPHNAKRHGRAEIGWEHVETA